VADGIDGATQLLTPITGDEQTVLTDDDIKRSLQNAVRAVAECARLDGDDRPPLRSRRAYSGSHFRGDSIDVVQSSELRGSSQTCNRNR
jgi:hypothetical protein